MSYIDRISSLMGTRKSGMVALLSDGTAVVWLQPLHTIFARCDCEDSYRECDSVAEAERFMSHFAGQRDERPLTELGCSLTGAETVEQDIAAFSGLLEDNREFAIGDERFCLQSFEDEECGCVYALCKIVPDSFTDEETGETFPVELVVPVFQASRPGILYAKCLAYAAFLTGCRLFHP